METVKKALNWVKENRDFVAGSLVTVSGLLLEVGAGDFFGLLSILGGILYFGVTGFFRYFQD